jgi:hypothetical protein
LPAGRTGYPAAEEAREPSRAAGPDEVTGPDDADDSAPGGGWQADGYWADPQPAGVHQFSRWSWQPEGDGAPTAGEDPRDAPGHRWPRQETWLDDGQEDESWRSGPRQQAPLIPVVGPTAAVRGRAGGPGFAVPPGAVAGLYDPAQRTGWQLAQGLWEESGIGWERPAAETRPEPVWDQYAPAASPGPSWRDPGWRDSGRRSTGWQDSDWHDSDWQDSDWQDSRQDDGWQDGGRQNDAWQQTVQQDDGWQDPPRQDDAWQQTVQEDDGWHDPPQRDDGWQDPPQRSTGWQDGGRQAGSWEAGRAPLAAPTFAIASESDELYRAWQGSVRQAAGRPKPRMTVARRHQAWQVARVAVPAAILVTVGAGAVMMLTGRTNGMLAGRASEDTPAPGAGDSAVTFAGYPGQRGTVTVDSIATAAGTRLAVGSADGHPAIWRRGADGAWTLVSAAAPALFQRPGMESLTSVAHGPAGWLAVGDVVSGTAQRPVVVTSSDGRTWHAVDGTAPFAGPGTFVMAVTASRGGYVVVGKQVSGGRTFAALWWSADLRNWAAGSNGGLDGRLQSSAVYAVDATAMGFVAAGTHGGAAAIWTSADGRSWSNLDVPGPAGAPAALREVAVNGTRVVVAGYAAGKAGDVPLLVVSTDSGSHWRQVPLGAPAGSAAVTALTAAGNGFVAAGLAGPAGAQHAVTWSSPDGLTWSAAAPVTAGQITALTATGGTVSGTAQRGAGSSVVTLAAP